jgi:hypothetical protein
MLTRPGFELRPSENDSITLPVYELNLILLLLDYKLTLYLNKPTDRLCVLMVRVSGYGSRGPGFDSRRFQIL